MNIATRQTQPHSGGRSAGSGWRSQRFFPAAWPYAWQSRAAPASRSAAARIPFITPFSTLGAAMRLYADCPMNSRPAIAAVTAAGLLRSGSTGTGAFPRAASA